MNALDDDDLIDRLQSALAEQQSGIRAPEGIGVAARRTARQRTATRALGAVPLLVAAVVATVLATSPGSHGTAASRGAGGAAVVTPSGPLQTQDAADIVRRVQATVAGGHGATVIHTTTYERGAVSRDGSLTNLGAKLADEYDYATPGGTVHTRSVWRGRDGKVELSGMSVLVPDARGAGKGTVTRTLVDPVNRTYSRNRFPGVSNPLGGHLTPNLASGPSEVQRALSDGQVTRTRAAAIDGRDAIALSIDMPRAPGAGLTHITLYVDAHSYRPLRTVQTIDGAPQLQVADWLPATHDNVLRAETESIPAGYTKVTQVK